MRNFSRLIEERKGSALAKGCLFPTSGLLFQLQPRSSIRSGAGIMQGGIRSSLSHPSFSKEFSVNVIISPGDDLTSTIRSCVPGVTVGHWTVKPYFMVTPAKCGVFHYCVVRSPIARKSWNSISSFFWMFISYFLDSLFAFAQFIFQEKKMFPFYHYQA